MQMVVTTCELCSESTKKMPLFKKKDVQPSIAPISFKSLPPETIVEIATFFELADLFNFSRTDSKTLHLLFNYKRHNYFNRPSVKEKNAPEYFKKDETPEFDAVQQAVWKNLVCFYFPRFNKALNVKNWMQVMRRRIKHVKLYGNWRQLNYSAQMNAIERSFSEQFSILEPGLTMPDTYEAEFIENCEWIYKCPITFENLEYGNVHYCSQCGEDVFIVRNQEEFKQHSNEGHCIIFTLVEQKTRKRTTRVGKTCVIE